MQRYVHQESKNTRNYCLYRLTEAKIQSILGGFIDLATKLSSNVAKCPQFIESATFEAPNVADSVQAECGIAKCRQTLI